MEPYLPDRNQEDGLDSQLACSYECDLGRCYVLDVLGARGLSCLGFPSTPTSDHGGIKESGSASIPI